MSDGRMPTQRQRPPGALLRGHEVESFRCLRGRDSSSGGPRLGPQHLPPREGGFLLGGEKTQPLVRSQWAHYDVEC